MSRAFNMTKSWNDFLESKEFTGEHGHNRAIALLGERVRESLVALAADIDRIEKGLISGF